MQNKSLILLLIIFPTLLYSTALTNSFHYDDLHTIVNNAHIRSYGVQDSFRKILTFFSTSEYYSSETHHVKHYRPLLYATYVFNYSLSGLSPTAFRVVNLGLHIGCIMAIFFLSFYLFGRTSGAFFAALIFAIHPLFSEAVNYISARSSVLATFFYLLAFYQFIKFRDARTAINFSLFILSAILAFLSKEIAITLPLIMLFYDFVFTRDKASHKEFEFMILPYLPLILLGILLLDKTDFIQYFKSTYLTATLLTISLPAILAQIKGIGLILWLFIFPFGISIEHGILPHESSWCDADLMGVLLLMAVALVCVIYLLKRNQKVVAFFLAWFWITSMPNILIPLNVPLLEHRSYLSGVGLVILLGWTMEKMISASQSIQGRAWGLRQVTRTGVIMVVSSILILYAGLTLQRNTVWKDEVMLWSDAVSTAPNSERAWTNLGLAHLANKDRKRAQEAFQKALSINPNAVLARVGVGSSYHLEGKLDAAVQAYQDAIDLYPGYFLPYFNLGVAYQQQGQYENALRAYQEVLKINAHHPETHLNLGGVYLALGRQDLAIAEYQEALKLNPGLADAHFNLGVIYEASGQGDLADRHYKQANQLRKRGE